jgi:hypothetical protein
LKNPQSSRLRVFSYLSAVWPLFRAFPTLGIASCGRMDYYFLLTGVQRAPAAYRRCAAKNRLLRRFGGKKEK